MAGVPLDFKPKPPSQRKFSWGFFGDTNGKWGRSVNLQAIQKIPGGVGGFYPGWWFGSNETLPASEVRKQLEESKVCPVWVGYNSGDSFRWMEVLESGCIPIPDLMVSNYLTYLLFCQMLVFGKLCMFLFKTWVPLINWSVLLSLLRKSVRGK